MNTVTYMRSQAGGAWEHYESVMRDMQLKSAQMPAGTSLEDLLWARITVVIESLKGPGYCHSCYNILTDLCVDDVVGLMHVLCARLRKFPSTRYRLVTVSVPLATSSSVAGHATQLRLYVMF